LDDDRRSPLLLEREGAPARAQLITPADSLGCGALAHPPSGVCSPRRPSGRNTRIRIRIEKRIASVQSEPGACQLNPSLKAWMEPLTTARSPARGSFPTPPRTAAVNAIRPSWNPCK